MNKPKYFPKLKAWYYRQIYKKYLYEICFDSYKPELFERLYITNGIIGVYLGNGKFLETYRHKNDVKINHIPKIEIYDNYQDY